MTDSNSLDDKLDKLADYVERTGDKLDEAHVESIVSSNDGEKDYTGHRCFRQDDLYVIAGHSEDEFIHVLYFLSAVQNIAKGLPEELATNLVAEDAENPQTLAATKLLDEVDRNLMSAYRDRLVLYTTSGPISTEIHTNEAGSVTFLEFGKRIFPLDSNFSVSEFNDAVQTVVSNGQRASSILSQSVNLHIDEDEPQQTQIDLNLI